MKTTHLKTLIKEVIKEVINEIEPYDPESDTFAPGPRDRDNIEEPPSNTLNIPEYPQSIVKQVVLDGKTKFFVYSDSTPTALILGYGDTNIDAIENAKKTARYIKQGGVDNNFGELK